MHLNWHSEVEKMNTESPCNSITVWICYVLSVWIMEHHQLPWNSVFLSVKKDNTSWSFCNNHMEEWDKSMWNSYQWMSIGMLPFILDYRNVKVKVKSFSRVWLFATQWTKTHQAPPSMGFSRQEYWSGLPFPSPNYKWCLNCLLMLVLAEVDKPHNKLKNIVK